MTERWPRTLSPLRWVGIGVLLHLFVFAGAQDWTVQTAAFQDYRQASSQVEELRALGFDAYSEFSMNDGVQYARVRVGCFRSRETAASVADDLRGFVTAEAVPQPLTPGARTLTCVRWDVGFVKPAEWSRVRRGSDIVFEVQVGDVTGYLHHDGNGWRLRPELEAPPASDSASGGIFEQVRVLSTDQVRATLAGGQVVNACRGTLLWQEGNTAVVERPNSVIACVVDERLPTEQ